MPERNTRGKLPCALPSGHRHKTPNRGKKIPDKEDVMLNKVQLIGRLGQDPQSRNNGVVTFTLATNEVWRDKNGDKQGRTEWHNIVAFGPVGDICAQYLKQGSLCYLEGKIQTTRWTPANGGDERQITQIVANGVKFLPSGKATVPGNSDQTPQNLFSAVDTDVPF